MCAIVRALALFSIASSTVELTTTQDASWSTVQDGRCLLQGRVKRSKTQTSVCVVSRIIQSELPYIRSWLKHYESLGVQTFYLLTNQPGEAKTIRSFFKDLGYAQESDALRDSGLSIFTPTNSSNGKADIRFYIPAKVLGGNELFHARGSASDIATRVLADIKEDFVVSVDIDEYWVMPNKVSTFAELVAADGSAVDIYYASWMMIPNDHFDALTLPYPVFRGHEEKWMARTSKLEEFGVHNPKVKSGLSVIRKHGQGDLMHFWARTFADPLLKGATQTGMGKGCEGSLHTIGLLKQDLLPQRLKLLAFLAVHPSWQVSFQAPLVEVDQNLEMRYTSMALNASAEKTQGMLARVRELYERFKTCLSQQNDLPSYPGGKSLLNIATYLDESACNAKQVSLLGAASERAIMHDLD